MGRLIRKPRRPEFGANAPTHGGRDLPPYDFIDEDTYLERVTKYVPAEMLALSVLANGLVGQAIRDGGVDARMAGIPVTTVAAIMIVIMTVLSAGFVLWMREKDDAWALNAAMSALAFPVWSYALAAPAFEAWWDGYLAAMLLAAFSLASGLVKPRAPARLRLAATKTEYRMPAAPAFVPMRRAG